jgi:DNA helicase-2/ATP-dependent DNA helicase PcrA
VGDDFQAIYGWRGANIDIIMGLSTDPDWEVIKLETNYRSVSCIIDASNKLISHNKQTQKILRAAREIEGDIMTLTFEDDITEAERVVKSTQIFQGYSDIAVLARTNAQLDKLKNMFDACDVPCVVLSNKDDVFKKGHIKSLLSVFNVCMNPKDDYSFYSAINFPERRLTDMQLTELKLKSTMKETSLFSTLTYTDFNKEILDIFDKVNKIDPFAVFTASGVYWVIVDMLNLISLYSNSGLGNRVTDLYEVGEKIEDWEQSQLKTGDSVDPHAFLKWLKLKDIQEKLVKKSDAVKLMTVHGSKGLEFEIVYVIGLNEDLFPSSKGDIEEERRLMYVAMTRAKDCLYLSSTATRNCKGQLLFCSPSRFLKELK